MNATRFLLIGLCLCLIAIPTVSATATNWTYSTAGTYYWVCPANVTNILIKIAGGGGGGMGGWGTPGMYYGLGGSSSTQYTYADIAVTPGTNYTLIVGPGGANSTATSGVSYDGGSTLSLIHI